jgi:hypothetical protein
VAVVEEFSELPHVEEFILGAAILPAYGVFVLPADHLTRTAFSQWWLEMATAIRELKPDGF